MNFDQWQWECDLMTFQLIPTDLLIHCLSRGVEETKVFTRPWKLFAWKMVSMPPGLWPESTWTEPCLSLSMTRLTLCLEAFLGKESFIFLSYKYTSAGHQARVLGLRIYFLGSESVKSSWLFEKESLASGTTQKPSWFGLLKNFPWWPRVQMEMLLAD